MTTRMYRGELSALLVQYRDLGREEAAQHRPPSDAKALDHNESTVLHEAAKHIGYERASLDDSIRLVASRCSELRQRLIKWRGRCEEALLDRDLRASIDSELVEGRGAYVKLAKERKRAEVELRMFRFKHEIDAAARYPLSLWNHLGIIGFLLLFETVMNAVFYQNDQGLIGGAVVALGVSLINLGSAAGFGVLFRYKNLRPIGWQLVGWGSLLAALSVALYLNALFAAFRPEYASINPEDLAQLRAAFGRAAEAAGRIFVGELPQSDFLSFLLFGLGILFSLVSVWKGYTSFDRYPGHQPLDEQFRAIEEAEDQARTAISGRLLRFLKGRQEHLRSLQNEVSLVAVEASTSGQLLKESTGGAVARMADVKRDAHAVIEAYRHANASIRVTESPRYFASMPEISVNLPSEVIARTEADLAEVGAETESARSRYGAPLQELLQDVLRQSHAAQTDGLRSFQIAVEMEAEEEINRHLQVLDRAS